MKVFIGVFLTIGVGLLAGAYYLLSSTLHFVDIAVPTTGIVIENRYERSDDSGSYYGYIKFHTDKGKENVVRSSVGTNPPAFSVGETVEVLYDPKNPEKARIKTFMQLWFLPLILSVMGFFFSIIPIGVIFASIRSKRLETRLRHTGDRINAKCINVEQFTNLTVNGQHPYIVVCQWKNPMTNQLHIFRSGKIWFNPEAFVKDKIMTVFIDRSNPSKYHVDLSMLPKVSGS